MDPEVQLYLSSLDDLRKKFAEALQGMSAEELNWAPLDADTNSPCALATHMAGSESAWILQAIGGQKVVRDREAEFRTKATSAAQLTQRLEQVGATTRQILSSLGTGAMDQLHTPPAGPATPQRSARYCVLHTIEHWAEHLGHLGLTKQMYHAKQSVR